MDKKLEEIFIRQMLLPKEELAMQTMELLADKMDLQSKIDKAIEYCEEVIKEHNNGEYNVSTVELAIKEHKENIKNVLDILKEDNNE